MTKEFEILMEFEEKYGFLYSLKAGEYIPYINIRESILQGIRNGFSSVENIASSSGKKTLRRLVRSIIGMLTYSRSRATLIFTSAVFRRDQKRNLAVEFIKETYPDALIFEWPCLNQGLDTAYHSDRFAKDYVPLDFFILINKIYRRLMKNQLDTWQKEYRCMLEEGFTASTANNKVLYEEEIKALIIKSLPSRAAETKLQQRIMSLFFKSANPDLVIDFFGAAREIVYPVIEKRPHLIELQHGIITNEHDSYIFPRYITPDCSYLFERTLMLYGERYRRLLSQLGNFRPANLLVIGNPRLIMYRKLFENKSLDTKREYILFSSQPYGSNYYERMVGIIVDLVRYVNSDNHYRRFRIAVKLHPRETQHIKEFYHRNLPPDVTVLDADSELYEFLQQSVLHITATSTTLYEAAFFGVPTLTVSYGSLEPSKLFGVQTESISRSEDIPVVLGRLKERDFYEAYLERLRNVADEYNLTQLK